MPSAPQSARDDDPAHLSMALQAAMRQIRRRLRDEVDRGGLTPSQTSVIVRLDREGAATMSELARAEGITAQSMSAVIAKLNDQGFLDRRADPEDGRQQLLSLSAKAASWLGQDRARRESWLATVLAERFSDKERQQLVDAIRLLERIT
ncbi:MarR family transcriptional regulator [Martelella alba]|uniref:MarR family transcriptional regulator n=1 Tax=Martelella alba TaxID=2590451 RepID=A0A506UIQ3_9HYPH|nr:MarR family transcriptional regulator [Martelella alba]TPW33143.1 MarR family transcriptional regulator [Martelella alba]